MDPSHSSPSSSLLHYCRWDYCARTFTSVSELEAHFSFDHIPNERAVYIPAHHHRRRSDGTWGIVEDSFRLEDTLSLPIPVVNSQTTADITTSTTATDMSQLPAASYPLPGSFQFTPDLVALPTSVLLPSHQAHVDYDSFLRSPSLPREIVASGDLVSPSQDRPLQSTPASQVPPATFGTVTTESQSSASLASPPDGRPFTTQALLPGQASPQLHSASHPLDNSHVDSPLHSSPNSVHVVSSSSGSSGTAQPPPPLKFGAQAGSEPRTPTTGVGFSWGLSRQ